MTSSRKIVATACAVLVGLTEIAEHVEAIKEHLPMSVQMHSQDFIVAILLAMVLYLLATHGEKETGAPEAVSHPNTNATAGNATANAGNSSSISKLADNLYMGNPPALPPAPPLPVKKRGFVYLPHKGENRLGK